MLTEFDFFMSAFLQGVVILLCEHHSIYAARAAEEMLVPLFKLSDKLRHIRDILELSTIRIPRRPISIVDFGLIQNPTTKLYLRLRFRSLFDQSRQNLSKD